MIAQHRAACEAIVRDCIDACSSARDERGRWRPQADYERRLELVYGSSAANAATAAAARRLGAYIAWKHS